MLSLYASLVPNISWQLGEQRTLTYSYLTEQHLHVIWMEQKYFKNLKTLDGRPITVISPGFWNQETGPDFLKAHLVIGNQELKGDVEFHLSEESWYRHKHHLDPRYNQVVLHISLWESKNKTEILTKSGKSILTSHLENSLTIGETRILQLIDLNLYPYKKFTGSGHCAKVLFHSIKKEKIEEFFVHAAQWRLLEKKQNLQKLHPHLHYQFGLGCARALGYKRNAEVFTSLFLILCNQPAIEFEATFAKLLGYCGFFKESYLKKWKDSTRYTSLYEKYRKKFPPTIQLSLEKTRPLNSPLRRLVLLAKFLAEGSWHTLYKRLFFHWQNHWEKHLAKRSWSNFFQELCRIIPSYQDPYWNFHYNFETKPQSLFLTLIGNDLKKEILLNAFFPLLFAEIREHNVKRQLEAFHQFYASISSNKSRKLNYLSHSFFGNNEKKAVLHRADTVQGALQLHQGFCTHDETSCSGCPFVDNYTTHFKE